MMKITDIRITRRDDPMVKALVVFVFESALAIRGTRIIKTQKGYSVSFPSRRRSDGSTRCILGPADGESRLVIEETILRAFAAFADGRDLLGTGVPRHRPGPGPLRGTKKRALPPDDVDPL